MYVKINSKVAVNYCEERKGSGLVLWPEGHEHVRNTCTLTLTVRVPVFAVFFFCDPYSLNQNDRLVMLSEHSELKVC